MSDRARGSAKAERLEVSGGMGGVFLRLDYFATGEGRTMMACIARAADEDEIRRQFAAKFGRWSEMGCEVARGLMRNECTEWLWSDAALKYIKDAEHRGGRVDAHCCIHVNFS